MVASEVKTIEDILQYAAEKHLPLEQMRFFIGIDYKEPRAFGIYRKPDGSVVVYKNKDDGSRAIRYEGHDEAYGVNEIMVKMESEVALRKKKYGNSSNSGSKNITNNNHSSVSSTKRPSGSAGHSYSSGNHSYGSNAYSSGSGNYYRPHREPRFDFGLWWSLYGKIIIIILVIVAIAYHCAVTPSRGYYCYDDSYYYYLDDTWYIYDDGWYPTEVDDFLEDNYSDYRYYDTDYTYYTDFTYTTYYTDYYSNWGSDSGSDSSWSWDDDDDWGSSWDSGWDSSWDYSDTDWGSDW